MKAKKTTNEYKTFIKQTERAVSFAERFKGKPFAFILALIALLAFLAFSVFMREPAAGDISVHFLNVGQADAALVVCDGETMLIDGGNRGDSSFLYSYLKKQGVEHLDYVVATHAHEDHIGGLPAALKLATVGTVYCPVTEFDSDVFDDFVDYVDKAGARITVPTAGETFSLGNATVRILAVNDGESVNNTSIVLKIECGNTSFLFTGDAEREVEEIILDRGYNIKSTVLKVGHHGSDSSTCYRFLREVMPEYAIISCGNSNSYGHPHTVTLDRLEDAGAVIHRTDEKGTMVCRVENGDMRFFFPDK